MADFSVISSRLATGAGVNSSADADALVAAGYTHIIDCRQEVDDAPFLVGSGLNYLWNPTADDGAQKPDDWFDRSVTFALDALGHHRMKVLAHCAAGVNRGPSTAFAIMLALGWTPEAAEVQIRAVRPQVGLAYKDQAVTALAHLGWTS